MARAGLDHATLGARAAGSRVVSDRRDRARRRRRVRLPRAGDGRTDVDHGRCRRRAAEGRCRARRRDDGAARGDRDPRGPPPPRRTGEGQLVEVDLLSTTLFALANQASNWLTAGVVAGRMGNRHPSIAPYETLQAADGPFVVAVGNDEQFATFCERARRAGARRRRTVRHERRPGDEPRGQLVAALEPALASAHRCRLDRASRCGRDPLRDGQQVDQAFELARAVGLEPVASFPEAGIDTVANPLHLSGTPVSPTGGPRPASASTTPRSVRRPRADRRPLAAGGIGWTHRGRSAPWMHPIRST